MSVPVDRLLNPASIAIVGASERSDAIGTRVLANLRRYGFGGAIYLVNPRYETIDGTQCWPSLASLPESVDAAFLAVPAASGPDLADEAGRCGIRGLFVNASGYADGGAEGKDLQRRLTAAATRHGIAIAGPNNMGLVNVHDRKAMWTQRSMRLAVPGPIGVISQSGTIANILLEDQRGLGLAYMVTTGNEAGATVADYLDAMVRDDRVTIVLLFLETLRDPTLFAQAADEASRRGKRIVALKVGASEGGRTLVQAHTGSLAGEDRLYDAFLKALGVIRVRDIDEMMETAVLLSADASPPLSANVVAVTLSGGEAALLSDIGGEIGLDFMPLNPRTLERLRPAFPEGAMIGNPVDAWGLGFDAERFQRVVEALVADPDVGTIAFSVNAPSSRGDDVAYPRAIADACLRTRSDKRIVFINDAVGNGVNPSLRSQLDAAGIAYLSGMRAGLAALRNMNTLTRSLPHRASNVDDRTVDWPRDDAGRFHALSNAGVPMIATEIVGDRQAAVRVAGRMGWPVVLKGVADHLPHKSDLGLVRLGLMDEAQVLQAFDAIAARLSQHASEGSSAAIVVQKMADEGIELIVGIRNDPAFGSFVVVGPGGILVDVANQISIRLGPVNEDEARTMLSETAAARMIAGVRGNGPYDRDAAAAAIAAFSRFGAARLRTLSTLEINPLIVNRRGVVGVDVLAEAHGASSEPG